MIKPLSLNSNVNFKARLNVDITDDYLEKIQNSPSAYIYSGKLLQGLKFLERTAPMIGTDKDVITLSNVVPKGRLFYSGNDRLLLNFNGNQYKDISETNYFSSMHKAMSELFSDVMDNEASKVHYRHSENVDATVEKIKSFNTVA